MARPTKLNDIIAKRIVDALAAGNPRTTAARLARIAPRTMFEWLRLGAEPDADELHAEFLVRVLEAEATAEEKALAVIVKAAAAGTWGAASWWLERKYPKRWALRPARFEGSGAPPSPAEVEQMLADAAALHAARKGNGT